MMMMVWAVVGLVGSGFEFWIWWPLEEHIDVPQHSLRVSGWRIEPQGIHSPCKCVPAC